MIRTLCIMSLYVCVYHVFLCVCRCIFFPKCRPVNHVSCLCKSVPCLPLWVCIRSLYLHLYGVSLFLSMSIMIPVCVPVCYVSLWLYLCIRSPYMYMSIMSQCFYVLKHKIGDCLWNSTFRCLTISETFESICSGRGRGKKKCFHCLRNVGDSENNGWEI